MTAPRHRVLLWGLVASLALNLFLIGVAVGYGAKLLPGDRDARPVAETGLRGYAVGLPPEHRAALRERLQEVRPAARDRRARLRELRAEIYAILRQPQPDRAEIDRRLAEIRAITGELQELMQATVFDNLVDLPYEVRQTLQPQSSRNRE